MSELAYRILADAVLLVHAAFVAFVVVGLLLIVAGLWRRWGWVRSFWFRLAHLAAIVLVVGQAWAGVLCPLTALENHLRRQADMATYPGGFVAYWVHRLLFYQGPWWVFALAYSLFGALVLGTFLFGPPRWPRRRRGDPRAAGPGSLTTRGASPPSGRRGRAGP